MTPFQNLLKYDGSKPPGECQAEADRIFPDAVAASRLHLWTPGQAIFPEGKRLLVGVAAYSVPDLILLDRLNEAVARANGAACRVDVFNTADCGSHADFDRYVPGIGKVFQTPVVGVWERGELKDTAWGKAGRDLLVREWDRLSLAPVADDAQG